MASWTEQLQWVKQQQIEAFEEKDWETLTQKIQEVEQVMAIALNSKELLDADDLIILKELHQMNEHFAKQVCHYREELMKELLSFKKHKSAVKAYRDESPS